MSKPVHVEVVAKPHEDGERLIKRFMRKVKKMGTLDDFRRSLVYEKPSDKRTREKIQRKRVLAKLRREQERENNNK